MVSTGSGEGDSEHVYYHIRFREPPDTTVREAVWGYPADLLWKLAGVHRDTAPPVQHK